MTPGSGGRRHRIHRDIPSGRSQVRPWWKVRPGVGQGEASPLRLQAQPSTPTLMKPPTDYIRHAARLSRKLQLDAAMGGTPQPDAEFYKALSKAFDEIAAGLEMIAKPD